MLFLLFFRGRLLVGTFVALSFNLFTMLSIRNKPFAYVSEGTFFINKKFNYSHKNKSFVCFVNLKISEKIYSEEKRELPQRFSSHP